MKITEPLYILFSWSIASKLVGYVLKLGEWVGWGRIQIYAFDFFALEQWRMCDSFVMGDNS